MGVRLQEPNWSDKLMTCIEKSSSTNRSFRATGLPSRARRITAGWLDFLLILLFTPAIYAQTYTDLFDFAGSSCCPQYPFLMAQGRDGNLYGTIASGGTNSAGLCFPDHSYRNVQSSL